MITSPPHIGQWREWLKIINGDVVTLHHDRHLFREIMGMIERNPNLPKQSVVYDWIIRQYVVSATMGVRRQVDTRRDVISMERLLLEIENNCKSITRDWFVAQYRTGMADLAHRDFDRFAPGGAPHVDPTVVKDDRQCLKKTCDNLSRWASNYVAHLNKAIALGQSTSPLKATWRELDEAIDLLGELLRKYELLLNQAGMLAVEPVILEDWQQVFRVPWLP
jgi:hypothetical protein